MSRFYIGILALLIAFVLLIIGVREISAHGEESAAAILTRGSDLCPAKDKPCWHGIVPGKTDLSQAATFLDADALFRAAQGDGAQQFQWCWASASEEGWRVCLGDEGYPISNQRIGSVRIEPPWDSLHLGEALLIFGKPLQAVICNPVYSPFGGVRNVQSQTFIGSVLYFENGISVLAYDPWQPQTVKLTPDMVVLRILYFPTSPAPNVLQAWRGFSTRTPAMGCAG